MKVKIKKKKIIITIIILVFLIFISTIFSVLNINNSKILKGVTINGVDVSNMTKEEASNFLDELINEKTQEPLTLTSNEYENTLYISSLDVNYDTSTALNEAYSVGRTGNIIQNNYEILYSLIFKKNIEINITLDEQSLDLTISDISGNIPNTVTQPSYYIEDENLIITKGTSGDTIKTDEFKISLLETLENISSSENTIELPIETIEPDSIDIEEIYAEIHKEVQDAYYEEDPFKVYAEVVGVDFDVEEAQSQIDNNPDETEYTIKLTYTYPEITTENLNIDIFPDLLATFSTRYDASNEDRSTNLQLAAEKISGTILSPGEEFSYNTIVGERTISAGYKEAKVYSNGQVVDGIGGGICQISSTLYNAVVFANLDVTERYNHQFVTSYVSPGRDATVSYGSKDLKFINNRTYPIKIIITVDSGIAKVDIYGIKEDVEYDISFDTETISTINYDIVYEKDSSLEDGVQEIKQAGANGIIVNTYKILKKNGIIVSKELISKDTYNALDRIIVNNTGTGED